jgi:hypothetical protein
MSNTMGFSAPPSVELVAQENVRISVGTSRNLALDMYSDHVPDADQLRASLTIVDACRLV